MQLRAWNSELYKWNQTLAQICALGMPSEIAGLDLLMAQAADMNARWTKLTIAVERREVCCQLPSIIFKAA